MKKEIIVSAIFILGYVAEFEFLTPESPWLSLAKDVLGKDDVGLAIALIVLPLITLFVGVKIEDFLKRKKHCATPHVSYLERFSEKHNG